MLPTLWKKSFLPYCNDRWKFDVLEVEVEDFVVLRGVVD